MKFSFCESIHASGSSPWHIRQLTSVGKKLGGCIDTPSLCGRVVNGWDLVVDFDSYEDTSFVCVECFRRFVELSKEPGEGAGS